MASPSRSGSVARYSASAFFSALLDRGDVFLVALDRGVIHLEALVGLDRAFLGHQVAHVTVGGQHLEVLAQVFLDGSCFGRRFDDDEMAGH